MVIDALFGTGLRGALRPEAAAWAETLNRSGRPVLAVDIPSGVEGATGAVRGAAVRAARTVTLAGLKIGLVFGQGPDFAGDVDVADIGIPVSLEGASWRAVDASDVAAWRPRRPRDTHKWKAGSVLVAAGSRGMSGAGVLSSSTALRAGAGLVVLAVPAAVQADLAGHPDLTEVMTAPFEQVPDLLPRFSCIAIGPGLRLGDAQRDLVSWVLKEARALIAAGHEVTAIGWDRAGSLPETEERAGLEIHRVRTSGSMRLLWKDLFRNPVWWRRAVHIARGLPFDAIHCHDLDTLPIGDRLKELTGRPLVYDAHEVFGYMIEADVPKVVVDYTFRMEQRLAPRADRVVAVNEAVKKYIEDAKVEKK